MLNKLQVLEDKYKELTEKISDIEVINDQKTWQKYMKEHWVDLRPVLELPAAQRGAGVLPVQRRAAAAAGKGGHRPAGVDEVHPPHPGGPAFLGRSL